MTLTIPESLIPNRVRRTVHTLCTYERVLPTLLFLAIFLAAALSPMQNDTWWQLRAGRDMWRTRHVLLTDYYSHTAYGGFWPNHEWLAEVVFYAIYNVGGLPLLSLFAASLIVSAWAIVWYLTPGFPRARFVLLACALPTASMHWEPRPHAFSILFVVMTVALILRHRYAWLPFVFWVWANCHGGVLLGLVILAVALAVDLVDDPGRHAGRALLVVLSCAIAVTLTPLGVSFWTEMAASIGRIHQYPLDEWQRPLLTDSKQLLYWLYLGALCVLLVRHWRALTAPANRELRVVCATAISLVPFSVTAVRGVGLFLMLAIPAIARLWALNQDQVRSVLGNRLAALVGQRTPRTERHVLNAALVAIVSLGVALTLEYAYVNRIQRLRWTPLPPRSIDALRMCPGNLYNRYDEGGYLVWFAPNHPVFLDGRQDPYPVSLVQQQIAVEHSGDYQRIFDQHDIGCAYLPTASPVFQRLVSAGWTPLYEDRDWAVLARPSHEPRATSSE